jgi:AbrB family looped-hinge helix DNA binding protein
VQSVTLSRGNLATKNDGTYLWTYAYDYENRLIKVQQGSTTVQQVTYDGDGKAIENIQTNTVLSIWKGFEKIRQEHPRTGDSSLEIASSHPPAASVKHERLYPAVPTLEWVYTVEARVGDKGRITLPEKIRETLGIKTGDSFYVEVSGQAILLKPKEKASVEATRGIARVGRVSPEEIEEAAGRE